MRMPPSIEFAVIATVTAITASIARLAGADDGIVTASGAVVAIAFGYEVLRSLGTIHLSSNVMVMAERVDGITNNGDSVFKKVGER
jgi:hypothetical protein